MNQVSVRIDKSWEDDAAGGIERLPVAGQRMGFNFFPRANCDDQAFAREQRAIFYRTDIAECSAATWPVAAHSYDLRCAGDEYGGGQGPDIMQESHRA